MCSSDLGMYLEVNTFYDVFSSYSLGGLEVLNNNVSNIVLDSKLLNDYTYTNYYCKDYNGKYINIEHESVGGGDISSDIDYSKVKLNGKLDKGLQVSYIGAESDIVSQFGIVPTIKNYGDDCLSLSFRIKNHTSISTPITIGVKNRPLNKNILHYYIRILLLLHLDHKHVENPKYLQLVIIQKMKLV